MSTNALISILDEDSRTMTSISLSCDGYFSHAGNVLLDHYNSTKRAKELMKLGNLFGLNPKISRKLPSIKKYNEMVRELNPLGRSKLFSDLFGERLNTVCIPFHYYDHSNKIEARVNKYPSDLSKEIESVLTNLKPHSKFHYVWSYRQWYVPKYNKNGNFISWEILTKKMCMEDK